MIHRLFTGLIAPVLLASAGVAAVPAQAQEDRPRLFSKEVASALFGGATAPRDRRALGWGTYEHGDRGASPMSAPRDRNGNDPIPYLGNGAVWSGGQGTPQRR